MNIFRTLIKVLKKRKVSLYKKCFDNIADPSFLVRETPTPF